MRFTVESWAPEYGAALAADVRDPGDAPVDAAVEVPPTEWAPRTPSVPPAATVRFVDGIRRTDAWIWISPNGQAPHPGIAASYAAGVVCCDGAAAIEAVEVRRAVFSAAPDLAALDSRYGRYEARPTTAETPEELSQELQAQMGFLEAQVALAAPDDRGLLVVDGPLSKLPTLERAVGYVKTHRRRYLSEDLERVVGSLDVGQRSPMFLTTAGWTRYSWYLRLPGPRPHAWAGIVRCEVTGALTRGQAADLADQTAATLPAFASIPHKDPRAPQNLVPIAQVERALRHRLGDPALVFRALRAAQPAA